MAKTAMDLGQALKEVWTSDRILEQMSGGYTTKFWNMPITIEAGSLARERKARQAEMMQRLAAKKRGNKPSYRERQKNGRKAAGR